MKNNKGFLLAESLVVSTFVLTVLIFLFVQYQNLMTTYKNNTDYNNPEAIYNLGSASEYFSADNSKLVSLSNNLGSNAYIKVYDKNSGCNASLGLGTFCDSLFAATGAKKVIYTSSNLTTLKNYIKNNSDNYLNQSLRDFIKRLDADEIDGKGRLIAQFDNGYFATIAINTSLNDVNESCIMGGLVVPATTSGDGLYKDEFENGKCVYKGTNPNNYIELNGELWRIVSKEADGTYKILKNDIVTNMAFDSGNIRTTGYCTQLGTTILRGCNAWSSTANMVGSPAEFTNGTYTGVVDADSEILTYLNEKYLNSITSDRDKMVSHDYNIGGVAFNNNDLTTQLNDEKSYKWNGRVGLISVSDYINANSNMSTCRTFASNSSNSTCANTNWMYKPESSWWTLSPSDYLSFNVFHIYNNGTLSFSYANDSNGVRPVIFLNSSLTLSGSGTQDNPYRLL